jgi:anti-sigma factor RsiW
MNCDEARTHTCSYIKGDLAGEAKTRLEAHLAGCPDCTRFVALGRSTSCKDLADFLSEYLEGRLPGAQRAVFESHLSACPPCVDYMRSFETTIQAGKLACSGEVKIPERLVNAILKARKQT